MTDIIVNVTHLRAARFCSRGARTWFNHHGLDYATFISQGLPVELIEGTGDALGTIVADIARRDAAGEIE